MMTCLNLSAALRHHPPSCTSSFRRHHPPRPNQDRYLKITENSNKNSDYAAVLQGLCRKKKILIKLKSQGITEKNDLLPEVKTIFDEMIYSCYALDVDVVSKILGFCCELRDVDTVDYLMWRLKERDFKVLESVLWKVVVGFGGRGEIELMEFVLEKMELMGVRVDSVSGNAFVICYSVFGSLSEMEVAYGRLKRSRILIEEEAIRTMALAYIKEEKFYSLGKFVEDVGLGRKNVGNLLWDLLILSYAAKFKMKSMQREFVRMVESGFKPGVTTFNIRAMAFSKMMLFADLHLSIKHITHEGVVPDIVTYGCVVDAYLERRLAKNLDFVLNNMNADSYVTLATDPLVFEAMGKVEFHSSSEALMEFSKKKNWTYKELIKPLS
ncbi:hypothetical protein Leryth_001016 [Lithospermum erythrorhizon]|nr:hypothetical protein Leryth_001016 [Lithospermum erythrorhizon]